MYKGTKKRAMALGISFAMAASNLAAVADSITAFAQEDAASEIIIVEDGDDTDNISVEEADDSSEEALEIIVDDATETDEKLTSDSAAKGFDDVEVLSDNVVISGNEVIADQGVDGYENFVEDTVIADIKFGSNGNVSSADTYSQDKGFGFSDVDYSTEAKGWSGNVYYPRVPVITSGASNVSDSEGYVAVNSKIWTETESTGYGVYTYETTSTFDVDLYNADYRVDVTLTNPTGNAYTAALEAEDITKVSGINVPAGGSATESFEANLVDGNLNLKFLGTSSATAMSDASTTTVYVSNVKITRLATEDRGEKPTIFVASDSTVQTYDSYYYPQTGWGQVLSSYFGDFVEER